MLNVVDSYTHWAHNETVVLISFDVSLLQAPHPDYTERFSHYGYPPNPPLSSYYGSGPEASSNGSLPTTQLNRVNLMF